MNKNLESIALISFNLFLLFVGIISIIKELYVNILLIIIITILMYFSKLTGDKNVSLYPSFLELFLLALVYLSLFLNIYAGTSLSAFWSRILLHGSISAAVTILGFILIYLLNKKRIILRKLNAEFVALFAFCFSFTIGTLWQILRFSIEYIAKVRILNYTSSDAMGFISVHFASSLAISILGYFYLKNSDDKYFIKRIIKQYLKQDIEIDENQEKLITKRQISRGETDKREFKSTLRCNVFTNELDKRIEHASLKTICAFLNSSGGTLFIGVDDDGDILGIEKDRFKNKDKIMLHLTNLINDHIGHQFIPYIKYQVITIESKDIIKIECRKSNKPIFLKNDKTEEFYIRAGPSSVQIHGSKLLDYVQRRFRK